MPRSIEYDFEKLKQEVYLHGVNNDIDSEMKELNEYINKTYFEFEILPTRNDLYSIRSTEK